MQSKLADGWKPEVSTRSIELGQIVAGIIVGAILGIAGMVYSHGTELAGLKEAVSDLESRSKVSAQANFNPVREEMAKSADLPVRPAVRPEELASIIRREQKYNVKESWGEYAYQSFTEDDLKSFKEHHVPGTVVTELRQDDEFLDVVSAIRALGPSDRQKLLASCRTPLHPTWAEIGEISRKGQTASGQMAEVMIADAVVDLVQDLVKLPADQFKKLYI